MSLALTQWRRVVRFSELSEVRIREVGFTKLPGVAGLNDFRTFYSTSGLLELARELYGVTRQHERVHWHVAKVRLEDGRSGTGGPIALADLTSSRRNDAHSIIRQAESASLGLSALRTRHSADVGTLRTVGAIEMAVLDAVAASEGRATAEFFGLEGSRSFDCYASMISADILAPAAHAIASSLPRQGFWGQKWYLPRYPDRTRTKAIDAIASIASDVPPEHQVIVDLKGEWDVGSVRELVGDLDARVQNLWLEQPVRDDRLSVAVAGELGRWPVVGGESCTCAKQLVDLCGIESLAAIQPDVFVVGGAVPFSASVDVAQSAGKQWIPHGRNLFASLHIGAIAKCPTDTVFEYNLLFEPERQLSFTRKLTPQSGKLHFRTDDWEGNWLR